MLWNHWRYCKFRFDNKTKKQYYAALEYGERDRMKILHHIHERNGHEFEGNVGTIDWFDKASYQIYENSK